MKINEDIRISRFRLVFPDGQSSIVELQEAKQYAQQYGLDLIEVCEGNDKNLAVCKLGDYGKIQYEKKKKEKKKHQNTGHTLKGMRLNYKTDEHDVARKNNKVREFLCKKYRVNYFLELRHRDRLFVDKAIIKFEGYLANFEDIAVWSKPFVSQSGRGVRISTTISAK